MTGFARESATRLPLHARSSAALLRRWLSAALSLVCAIYATAALAQSASLPSAQSAAAPVAPLPVDVAFPVVAYLDKSAAGTVRLKFDVQPGHYLYRDRFEFARDGESPYTLDKFKQSSDAQAKTKNDPNFGVVKVFESPVTLTVARNVRGATKLTVLFQGCSELAGVCYPPTRRSFDLRTPGVEVAANEAVKPGLSNLFKKNVSQ